MNAPLTAERTLLRSTLRFNAVLFGAILGVLTGVLLLAFATGLGALSDEQRQFAAGLLSIFLPGYGAGWGGGLAGFVWGFVDGTLLGAGVYWLHARSVLATIDRGLRIDGSEGGVARGVLRLNGAALGGAVGLMAALGLVATTNWLVLRGTADRSVHARLVAKVLPGYSVDLLGSLVGAIELFAAAFVLFVLFAAIYNRIAARARPHP